MPPRGILETCVYVDDLKAAEGFYRDVLGLEFVSRQEGRHAFFRCGTSMLLIFDPAESGRHDSDLPPHGAVGNGHVAFSVSEEELSVWKKRLVDASVTIEQEVDWGGRGRSLYFRDPAGNSLELAMPQIWGIHEAAIS